MNIDGLYALERELWEKYPGLQLTGIVDQLNLEYEDPVTGEREYPLNLATRDMVALRFAGPPQERYGRPSTLVPMQRDGLDLPRWGETIPLNMVAESMVDMYRDTLEREEEEWPEDEEEAEEHCEDC